jgi:hypothetical protein
MAQSLEVNIKTNSEVPKAMEKAKEATVSFGKQVEDVQKKFSTAFKDIALSFVAPLVILNKVIDVISNSIEKSKQEIKELRDFAATSNSPYLDPKTKYLANLRVATDRERIEQGMAPKATTEEYAYFLQNDPRSKQVLETAGLGANLKALLAGVFSSGDEAAARSLAANPEIKAAIDRIIEKAAADAEKNAQQQNEKPGTFKGPEGFGTVIGVGANPVMEAMTRQNEILEEIKLILQEQSANDKTGVGNPFTERAAPLTMMKEGIA